MDGLLTEEEKTAWVHRLQLSKNASDHKKAREQVEKDANDRTEETRGAAAANEWVLRQNDFYPMKELVAKLRNTGVRCEVGPVVTLKPTGHYCVRWEGPHTILNCEPGEKKTSSAFTKGFVAAVLAAWQEAEPLLMM